MIEIRQFPNRHLEKRRTNEFREVSNKKIAQRFSLENKKRAKQNVSLQFSTEQKKKEKNKKFENFLKKFYWTEFFKTQNRSRIGQ